MSDTSKRKGTAVWLPDEEVALARMVAAAEERTFQTVVSRAIRDYADASPEYQAVLNAADEAEDGA